MARAHTLNVEKWGVWGSNPGLYIKYAISLLTELSPRELQHKFYVCYIRVNFVGPPQIYFLALPLSLSINSHCTFHSEHAQSIKPIFFLQFILILIAHKNSTPHLIPFGGVKKLTSLLNVII